MRLNKILLQFLLIFLPSAIVLGAVAAYFVDSEIERKTDSIKANNSSVVLVAKQAIARDIESVTSDLMFLASNSEFDQMGERLSSESKQMVTREFLRLMDKTRRYDQVRFLDETGMEVVRVNFNGGHPSAVAEADLQPKGKRYYFKDTFDLNRGEVFVSPLDLNIEGTEIEKPFKPMIRVGTPVFDGRGRKRGIILLNYLGARLLANFHAALGDAASHSMLLNRDGYWLHGLEPEQEWGFMFDNDQTLAKRSPVAWKQISGAQSGQFVGSDGLLTFDTIYPLLEGQRSSSGTAEAFAPSREELRTREYFWKVVVLAPRETLDVITTLAWRQQLIIFGPTMALLFFGALWAAVIRIRHREAQMARRESEECFHLAMQHAPIGNALVATDGRWLAVNPALCQILGYARDELLVRDFQSVTHPDDLDADLAYVRQMLAGEINTYRMEKRYLHKDGHVIPVQLDVSLVHDEAGAPRYFISQVQNISARKQAEAARDRSEQELRAVAARLSLVLKTAAEGIIGIDDEGRVMFATPAAASTLGWPVAEKMIGKSSREVTGHILADGSPCSPTTCRIRMDARTVDVVRVMDEFFTRRDGTVIPVEYVVAPLLVEEVAAGAVVAFHDISDRKAMETELKRSNAELEQFAYVASHDLRQPLRMITSYLALISKHLKGRLDPEDEEFIGFATDGAKRMDGLILGLLEYSRVGRSRDAELVPLGEVIEEAVQNMSVAIHEANADVVVADAFPTVRGDRLELMRLFQNLIGNAVKYRAPDHPPHIEVVWKDGGANWLVSVTDNGIGMAPEDHERAFAIFQRLVSREQYEGTGIGLAVCKKIVEHHGGSIWVESELGVGSTFFFSLPKGNKIVQFPSQE